MNTIDGVAGTPFHHLRLFVSGIASPEVQAAQTALRDLCQRLVPGSFELELVDVLASPDVARQQRILATPTLLRLRPEPVIRIVGDLTSPDQLARALGLDAPSALKVNGGADVGIRANINS